MRGAEIAFDLIGVGLKRLPRGHVQQVTVGVAAGGQAPQGFVETDAIDVGQGEARPGLRKLNGQFPANAGTRAGNDHHFVLKHVFLSLLF